MNQVRKSCSIVLRVLIFYSKFLCSQLRFKILVDSCSCLHELSLITSIYMFLPSPLSSNHKSLHFVVIQNPHNIFLPHLKAMASKTEPEITKFLPKASALPSALARHRQLAPNASLLVSPLCLGSMNFGDAMKGHMGECTKETSFESKNSSRDRFYFIVLLVRQRLILGF